MAKAALVESPYPKTGNKAPIFSATGSGGKTVKLADFKDKKIVVLYFYPKDNTPGCTKEACGFRDSYDKLKRAGAVVLGVSPDSADSHEKFISKFNLPFVLLADPDKKICQKYGVWQEKSIYGKKTMGVVRTTFIIDKKGKIAHIFEKVKPEGHEEEILHWIKENR